jgi:hypothetical protein
VYFTFFRSTQESDSMISYLRRPESHSHATAISFQISIKNLCSFLRGMEIKLLVLKIMPVTIT